MTNLLSIPRLTDVAVSPVAGSIISERFEPHMTTTWEGKVFLVAISGLAGLGTYFLLRRRSLRSLSVFALTVSMLQLVTMVPSKTLYGERNNFSDPRDQWSNEQAFIVRGIVFPAISGVCLASLWCVARHPDLKRVSWRELFALGLDVQKRETYLLPAVALGVGVIRCGAFMVASAV